jgi:hypothetical protein
MDIVEVVVAPGVHAVATLGIIGIVERHAVAQRRLGHAVLAVVLPRLRVAQGVGVGRQLALGVIGIVEPGLQRGRPRAAGLLRPHLHARDAAFRVAREPQLAAHGVAHARQQLSRVLEDHRVVPRVPDGPQHAAPAGQGRKGAYQPRTHTAQLEARPAPHELQPLAAMKGRPRRAERRKVQRQALFVVQAIACLRRLDPLLEPVGPAAFAQRAAVGRRETRCTSATRAAGKTLASAGPPRRRPRSRCPDPPGVRPRTGWLWRAGEGASSSRASPQPPQPRRGRPRNPRLPAGASGSARPWTRR